VSESGLRVLDVRRQLWFDALLLWKCLSISLVGVCLGSISGSKVCSRNVV
jgi:hypothetical protein